MKITKTVISYIATVGATVALGALSFTGMLLITPSLPWACLAFFMAAAIEGAVYKQNIFASMKKLGNQTQAIQHALAIRELKKLQNNKKYKNNIFLTNYFNQKKYLHELQENHGKYTRKNAAMAKKEIVSAEKRIQKMEEIFIHFIRYPQAAQDNSYQLPSDLIESLQELKNTDHLIQADALEKEVLRKKIYMNIGLGVAIGAGACAGLVSLASIPSGLLTLGITLSTAALIAAPFAAFAALGYMFLMYRTITDMIQNETLNKWAHKIHRFWHTPSQERTATFYLKITAVIVLSALAIFATIATAGTWWHLAKAGASTIPYIPVIAAKVFSIATWTLMLIPNFLFDYVNSLKSLQVIKHAIVGSWRNTSKDVKNAWNNSENVLQFLNPFRLIKQVFNAVTFVGHLISIGLTGDQVPWLNPYLTTAVGSAVEGLSDLHYIAEDHHVHDHQHHDHNDCHQQDTAANNQQAIHTEDEQQLLNNHHRHSHHHVHENKHDDDEEHQHSHGDFILNIINTGLNYLSSGWDWFCGSKPWSVSEAKFFTTEALPKAPPLSTSWILHEVGTTLQDLEQHYKNKGITDKANAFYSLKTEIETLSPGKTVNENESCMHQLKASLKNAALNHEPLSQHRHTVRLFTETPPKSQQAIEAITNTQAFQL
jgi:hypothetical protein